MLRSAAKDEHYLLSCLVPYVKDIEDVALYVDVVNLPLIVLCIVDDNYINGECVPAKQGYTGYLTGCVSDYMVHYFFNIQGYSGFALIFKVATEQEGVKTNCFNSYKEMQK